MLKKLVAGVAMLSLMNVSAEACTVMVVTKGASTDGSMIVSPIIWRFFCLTNVRIP